MNSSLVAVGAVVVSVLAFETWFRVTSLKEIEKNRQALERARAEGKVA